MVNKTKLDTLYEAYWGIVDLLHDGLKRSSVTKVVNGPVIEKFLSVTSSTSKDDVRLTKMTLSNTGFYALPKIVQNLLMAVAEINMRLSRYEDDITESLSQIYLVSSQNAFNCLINQHNEIKKYEIQLEERILLLHLSTEKHIMPFLQEFINKCTKLYAEGYEMCKSAKIEIEYAHIFNLRNALDALNLLKRSVIHLKNLKKTLPEIITINTKSEDLNQKIEARLQKNEIFAQQKNLSETVNDPFELARAIEILNIAESEASAKIQSLENNTVEKTVHSESNYNHISFYQIDQLLEEIYILINLCHVYNAESNKIYLKIKEEIEKESKLDLESLNTNTSNNIYMIKQQLEQSRTKALNEYDIKIKDTKNAELVLVSEMNKHSLNTPSLNICKRDLIESSKNHRLLRDIEVLKIHKLHLHKIGEKIKEVF